MPRRSRFVIPGQPHHVIARGHNKARTFYGRADYELYLGLLQEHLEPNECLLHAYALMPNHVHLMVTPRTHRGISDLMAVINQRFVQNINRHRGRCGSSWQGRFKSSVVDSKGYALTCQRYIDLNPVRAGIVLDAADYPWSSYRTLAFGEPSLLVVPHDVYLALGEDAPSRQALYRSICEAPLRQEELDLIRIAAAGNRPLGDREFLERMQLQYGIPAGRLQRGPRPVITAPEPESAIAL